MTTKGSALSSRNPILSPHWPEAIDGWKKGMQQPIRKRERERVTAREGWERERDGCFHEHQPIRGGEKYVECSVSSIAHTLCTERDIDHIHKHTLSVIRFQAKLTPLQ